MNNTDITLSLDSLKDSFIKESEEVLAAPIREFLQDNPEVKGISWTQYTPYFNDGSACTFDLGEIFLYLNSDESDFEYFEGYSGWCPLDETEADNYQKINEEFSNLCKFLYSINEELYRILYGDHVQVIVTREEIIKRHYNHD